MTLHEAASVVEGLFVGDVEYAIQSADERYMYKKKSGDADAPKTKDELE